MKIMKIEIFYFCCWNVVSDDEYVKVCVSATVKSKVESFANPVQREHARFLLVSIQ